MATKKKQRKKSSPLTYLDAIKCVRCGWGGVNPITRVVENKKKYKRKSKYGGKNNDQD